MKSFRNEDNLDDSRSSGEPVCKKKKRSRWETNDDDADKAVLNGLPTSIPMGLTKEQEEQYLLQLQIEEITRRLRTGELGIPKDPSRRSPSPEPTYGVDGKRVNTRECRVRKKLEDDRHALILRVLKINPDYKPPNDYKASNAKYVDKVFIPQEEHPSINFIGLLLGPRGNTLKQLTQDSGATIVIRGKGSVKEGKLGFKDGKLLPGQDEPLHAYVTSTKMDSVQMACDKIRQIIKEGIEVPDTENELRKQQLRELALLNGTLRDGDALSKLRQLAEAQTIVTNQIICTICGGAGHIAGDCKLKKSGDAEGAVVSSELSSEVALITSDKASLDSEYMSLMAELNKEPSLNADTEKPQLTDTVAPTSSSVATPGWQGCPPMWGGNYMMPPWVPIPPPFGMPCYGAMPPFNPMFGQPYMPPMFCNPDGSGQGFPPAQNGEWNQTPSHPAQNSTQWNPPPPPTPAIECPPPPPLDDIAPPPLPPQDS